jgi:hypothetical protein
MKKALVATLMGALFAGFAMAQPYFVELDLDGVLGNGPDVVSAEVSDYIDVNVWITGTGPMLFSTNFTICNMDGSLEFQGFTSVDIPGGWTQVDPTDVGNGCWLMQAIDLSGGAPLAVPFLHGVVTYHAAVDHTFDDLTIDLDPLASGWFNTAFGSGGFEDFVGAGVQIGTAATEETNWGAVKGLFR